VQTIKLGFLVLQLKYGSCPSPILGPTSDSSSVESQITSTQGTREVHRKQLGATREEMISLPDSGIGIREFTRTQKTPIVTDVIDSES